MAQGYITIGTELDTKSFDKQIEELENKLTDLEGQELYFAKNNMPGELQDVQVEIEKTRNKIVQLNKQKYRLGDTTGIDKMGKAFQGTIKNVSRLIVGIFGVRTAYMALRNASSTLSGYDEQYAANLEYIKYTLTQAIAPILRGIVQLAMQLLQLINAIVNSLFGINLFSNGSAENFRKMKAGASGVSKAVKEIRKQLTGFDEVNILTDQSDTGTSAGAGGVKVPDMDLSKVAGFNDKIDWAAILSSVLGLVSAFKVLSPLIKKFGLGLGIIKSLGIGAIIGGITYSVLSLLQYLKDNTWKNFGKIIQGIGVAVIGLGAVITSVPIAVSGAVVAITGTVIKYWDKIKVFLQNGIDWLVSKTNWIREHFGIIGEAIYNVFTGLLQSVLNIFDSIFTAIKGVFDGLINFLKGVFTGNWKQAWEGVQRIFTSVFDAIKGVIKGVWDFIKTLFSAGGKIFVGITEGIVGAFKAIVNALLTGINTIIAVPFNVINGLLNKIKSATIPVINVQPFMGLWNWNPLPVPQIPRLKTGGIINMPNKGTMLGGMAIGGEAGKERCYSSYRPRGHE